VADVVGAVDKKFGLVSADKQERYCITIVLFGRAIRKLSNSFVAF
jgi:hypothetical protein